MLVGKFKVCGAAVFRVAKGCMPHDLKAGWLPRVALLSMSADILWSKCSRYYMRVRVAVSLACVWQHVCTSSSVYAVEMMGNSTRYVGGGV